MSLKRIAGQIIRRAGQLCTNCCRRAAAKYCFYEFQDVYDCDTDTWEGVTFIGSTCSTEAAGPPILGVWIRVGTTGNKFVYKYWREGLACTSTDDCLVSPDNPPDPTFSPDDCPAEQTCGACRLYIGQHVTATRPTFAATDPSNPCHVSLAALLNSLPATLTWEIFAIGGGVASAKYVGVPGFDDDGSGQIPMVERIELTCVTSPSAGFNVSNMSFRATGTGGCGSTSFVTPNPFFVNACDTDITINWGQTDGGLNVVATGNAGQTFRILP